MTMSGRPRTTSFAEGNKGPPSASVSFQGMKITSKSNSQYSLVKFTNKSEPSKYLNYAPV